MLGNQKAFLEVKVNRHVGTVMLWVYGDKRMEETIPIDEEPVFNIVTDTGPMSSSARSTTTRGSSSTTS
ncbi:MAG: hypothetical protein ACYS6Z_06230 [Planctomycetota bacterium]|jgi:hypothetical protein